eukprot:209201-Pleurochrysis_carterae.AAC.1
MHTLIDIEKLATRAREQAREIVIFACLLAFYLRITCKLRRTYTRLIIFCARSTALGAQRVDARSKPRVIAIVLRRPYVLELTYSMTMTI